MSGMTQFGIAWATPHYFWLLLVVLVAYGCYLYRNKRVRATIYSFAGKWQSLMVKHFTPIKQYTQSILFLLGIVSIFLAILRPQWSKQEQVIKQEGRDVLIALDISKSMLAQDCEPNRLAFAKQKIRHLLKLLDSERVGLLLFSGSAFVQCPLTNDYGAFHMFLDHVDAETISSGSTALETAVKEGLQLFSSTAPGKNKLMILCTDGEDFSFNLAAIKKKAADQGVRIFALGVGTPEGAPIPLYTEDGMQNGHQKDGKGAVVISHRNDGILQELANDLGGKYMPMSSNNNDVKQIARQVLMVEKAQFEDKKMNRLEDHYHWFLFVGLLLLLVEWVL